MNDRIGKFTDILTPLTNDADRKLVLERALRAIGSTPTVTYRRLLHEGSPSLEPAANDGLFSANCIAVAKSKIEAGALMTDPFAERQARVRAVTVANFGKVISPTRAPVKPAAVEAGGGAGIGDKRRLGRLVRQLLKGRAENICSS